MRLLAISNSSTCPQILTYQVLRFEDKHGNIFYILYMQYFLQRLGNPAQVKSVPSRHN